MIGLSKSRSDENFCESYRQQGHMCFKHPNARAMPSTAKENDNQKKDLPTKNDSKSSIES